MNILLLPIIALSLFFLSGHACAASLEEELSGYVQTGAVIAELNGAPIVSLNPDRPLIPASILKIATSLWAIHTLDVGYKFSTEFFEKDGILYVRGNGDPFLTSEEVSRLAVLLKEKGNMGFSSIVLDDSRFDLQGQNFSGNSRNPYEAVNGALAVNFNTIYLRKTEKGVTSAEPQTPTLSLMAELAQDLPQGEHRISLPKNRSTTLRYVGELLSAILAQHGIQIENGWKIGVTPADAQKLIVFESDKDLLQVIEEMLLYSNNFIANQLFLTCGAMSLGYPATYEKSQSAAASFFASMTLEKKAIHMMEGSGIARENKITANAMLRIMHLFSPYHRLLPEQSGLLVKSGTLTGVYTFAGYHVENQSVDPFIIILNQAENSRSSMLHLLRQRYRAAEANKGTKKK